MNKIENKEESEQTILLNNYNYALNEEFDYLDKEDKINSSEKKKDSSYKSDSADNGKRQKFEIKRKNNYKGRYLY